MIEPKSFLRVAELIGETLNNAPNLYRWSEDTKGVTAYDSKKEKLVIYPMKKDDEIWFKRKSDYKGAMLFFNIQPKDIEDIKYAKPVIVKSENKASAVIEIDAWDSETQEDYKWSKEFSVGKSESDSLMLGASQSIKNTFGTGDGSPVKGETEFTTTISSEWTKQTGMTEDKKTGGEYEAHALPGNKKEAFLTWDEQDLKRHVTGHGTFEFGFRIGKRYKSSGKWWWRGSHGFDSFSEFLSTVSGMGSTSNPFRQYFYNHPLPPKKVQELKDAWPSSPYDQWYEYKGADGIKVVAKTIPKKKV